MGVVFWEVNLSLCVTSTSSVQLSRAECDNGQCDLFGSCCRRSRNVRHETDRGQTNTLTNIKLTEVEVTLVAFDLINGSTVKQIKAVNGEFLHLAKTHPPPQPLRPRCKGAGRQSGRLGPLLNLSHGCRFSSSAGASWSSRAC